MNVTSPRARLAFWRSYAIFEDFGEEAIAVLDGLAKRRFWSANETVFQRGDSGDYLVLVTEGRFRLSLLTSGGRELTLRHAGPGDMLGELSLLDGEPRSADATAGVDGEGLVLRRGDFMLLQDAIPETRAALIRYLSARLRSTTEQLESIALFEIEARLARFLLLTLRQVFEDDIPKEPHLRLDLNQSELAALLGASRPKVNRAIVSLESAGAIRRQGATLVCNPQKLDQFADPET